MISVCIATYNGGEYIKRQLDSILCQLSCNDEVIVSDDYSTDNTLSIVNSYNDPRIHIIKGAHRHSPIWNFEKALQACHGDYIFLSDQDDEWQKDKVLVTMKYLKDYDCVISDCVTVDDNGKTTNESFYKLNGTRTNKWFNLICKNGYLGCCMAFRRNVLEAAIPFPNDIPMHDIWIGNIAAFGFKIKFIPEKLIYFCRHGDNFSPTASKSIYNLFNRFIFRYEIIKGLFKRHQHLKQINSNIHQPEVLKT